MNYELAKTLTLALVNYLDDNRPEGTMDCSSGECVSLENAFVKENFDSVETLINKKLSRLTEFEQELVAFYNKRNEIPSDKDGVYNKHELEEFLHESAKTLLSLAKKQLLSYADESNPAIEAMADLERTFSCNPDKLPIWLKDELGKKHLDGYIKGREDAMCEMKDFIESHFNCENAKKGTPIVYNTNSGTSILKAEG